MQLTPIEAAALERLRRLKNGEDSASVFGHPPIDLPGGGKMCASQTAEAWHNDTKACIAALLRLCPGDSELPITEEWMRSVGLPVSYGSWEPRSFASESIREHEGVWRIYTGNPPPIPSYQCWKPGPPATRGDVRRLAAALGIQLKETTL